MAITGSKARQWLAKIDKPNLGIDKRAVEQMEGNAVAVAKSFANYIYVFDDGSSLYEKHRDAWYEGREYIQCPECDEWRTMREGDVCDECRGADDEQATVILKAAIKNVCVRASTGLTGRGFC